MSKEKKSKKAKCCCKSDNILECLSAIDDEIKRVKDCIPHKQISRSTKEKVLFCIVLRDIAVLEKKIDKILCELISDSWLTEWNGEKHSSSHCSSDCDSDSDSNCDCDSDSDSEWDCDKHSDCCHK